MAQLSMAPANCGNSSTGLKSMAHTNGNRANGVSGSFQPGTVLITGAAGFIGSHVCNRLVLNHPGLKVVVLDKLDVGSNLKNLESSFHSSAANFKFVKGNITSADFLNHFFVEERIDTVIHFAAKSHVNHAFGNSVGFTGNNVYGTHVLLEACKAYGKIKCFVHVSSDEVYGGVEGDAASRNHLAPRHWTPPNPYAAAKAAAESLVMSYGQSYGFPWMVVRVSNVYGPMQYPEKVIPKFLLLALAGKQLPIHGDGSSIRNYVYCDDVAEAFDIILHKGEIGQIYGIGTTKAQTVSSVARSICAVLGLDPEATLTSVEDRAFRDERHLVEDKNLRDMGWRERTTFEEGLEKTLAWYRGNGASYWTNISQVLVAHPP